MALIKCPECGKEISDLSKACIHCGCPVSDEQQTTDSQEIAKHIESKNVFTYKKKIIIVFCVVGAFLIAYFGLFHLDTEEKYAYDLIIENAGEFKSPKAIRVISGSAGWMKEGEYDEPYAFVCITSRNSYGAEVTGYYCLHPDNISDVSNYDSMINICKRDNLNVGNINRRLAIYWFFH